MEYKGAANPVNASLQRKGELKQQLVQPTTHELTVNDDQQGLRIVESDSLRRTVNGHVWHAAIRRD